MAQVLAAIVRGGQLEGNFATVKGANLDGNMEEFAELLKGWAGVDTRLMTVFGPWPTQPRVAEVAQRLTEEPCPVGDIPRDLITRMGERMSPPVAQPARAYFLVRITTPIGTQEAAAASNDGASVDSAALTC